MVSCKNIKFTKEDPKEIAVIFGEVSTSLNNFPPNSGRNMILIDIGN